MRWRILVTARTATMVRPAGPAARARDACVLLLPRAWDAAAPEGAEAAARVTHPHTHVRPAVDSRAAAPPRHLRHPSTRRLLQYARLPPDGRTPQ